MTVPELLIVGSLISLLLVLGSISLRTSRAKMRDAVRLADVQSMRAALTVYWQQHASYPVSNGIEVGRPGSGAEAFTNDGFVSMANKKPPVFLETIPAGPKANEYYGYRGGANGYSIRFETERASALGEANVYYAHRSGIDTVDELK